MNPFLPRHQQPHRNVHCATMKTTSMDKLPASSQPPRAPRRRTRSLSSLEQKKEMSGSKALFWFRPARRSDVVRHEAPKMVLPFRRRQHHQSATSDPLPQLLTWLEEDETSLSFDYDEDSTGDPLQESWTADLTDDDEDDVVGADSSRSLGDLQGLHFVDSVRET